MTDMTQEEFYRAFTPHMLRFNLVDIQERQAGPYASRGGRPLIQILKEGLFDFLRLVEAYVEFVTAHIEFIESLSYFPSSICTWVWRCAIKGEPYCGTNWYQSQEERARLIRAELKRRGEPDFMEKLARLLRKKPKTRERLEKEATR